MAPGVIFAALFVAGSLLIGDLAGSYGDPDVQFVDLHASAANRARYIVGGYLMAAAGIAFIWFVVPLTHRLESAGAHAPIGGAARISGAIFVAMLLASAASFMAVAGSMTFGELLGDDGQFASEKAALPQLGYVLFFVGAMLAASSTIAAVSLLIRENRRSHTLLRRGGYASALLLPASVIMTAFLVLLPLWILAASLVIMRHSDDVAAERRAI